MKIFSDEHYFKKFKILQLINSTGDEPFLSGVLSIDRDTSNFFTIGTIHKPDYSINFPAKRITTEMEWNDLVLEEDILKEVLEISDWIKYGSQIMHDWGMKKKIKPGYRSLFMARPARENINRQFAG